MEIAERREPRRRSMIAFEWTTRDDALRFRTIDNLPRFTDSFSGGQFLAKQVSKFAAAPNSLHKDWLEGEGTADFGFWSSDFGFQICKFVGRFCETPFILPSDTDVLQDECEFS